VEEKPAKTTSLEPPGDAVKEAKTVRKSQPERGAFARVLDGWELGAITVSLVAAAALLSVPREAEPSLFPVPLIDLADDRAERQRIDELADEAERQGLPFETRAVGDALRRFGVALSTGAGDAEYLGPLMSERVQAALRAGQIEPLRRLRAVQARLFVREVRKWRGPPSPELVALGGDFPARARRNGWSGPNGSIATDDELATLFILRWSELTRLRDEPHFRATLGEVRRYYRFLLLHPEQPRGFDSRAEGRASMRLRYVEALAHRDTEYPLELARGSLLGQLGRLPASAQALTTRLGAPGASEWGLRARNYLLFVARGSEGESDFSPGNEP
jgi:hypothetical protein